LIHLHCSDFRVVSVRLMELHLLPLKTLNALNSIGLNTESKGKFLRNAYKIAHRDMTEVKSKLFLLLSCSVLHTLCFHLFLYPFSLPAFSVFSFLQGISSFLFHCHLGFCFFPLCLLAPHFLVSS